MRLPNIADLSRDVPQNPRSALCLDLAQTVGGFDRPVPLLMGDKVINSLLVIDTTASFDDGGRQPLSTVHEGVRLWVSLLPAGGDNLVLSAWDPGLLFEGIASRPERPHLPSRQILTEKQAWNAISEMPLEKSASLEVLFFDLKEKGSASARMTDGSCISIARLPGYTKKSGLIALDHIPDPSIGAAFVAKTPGFDVGVRCTLMGKPGIAFRDKDLDRIEQVLFVEESGIQNLFNGIMVQIAAVDVSLLKDMHALSRLEMLAVEKFSENRNMPLQDRVDFVKSREVDTLWSQVHFMNAVGMIIRRQRADMGTSPLATDISEILGMLAEDKGYDPVQLALPSQDHFYKSFDLDQIDRIAWESTMVRILSMSHPMRAMSALAMIEEICSSPCNTKNGYVTPNHHFLNGCFAALGGGTQPYHAHPDFHDGFERTMRDPENSEIMNCLMSVMVFPEEEEISP